jgi:hypothetical protein
MGNLRVVAPNSATAWCEAGEIMVSAICVGAGNTNPVAAYPNGAKCGYGDSAARARILCAPAQEASAAPAMDGGGMQGGGGIHLVASDNNVAACEPGETTFSAFCTGGWGEYPLITYPDGRVKCGYSGGMARANVACMAGEAAGLRVVASDTNTAWCEAGETVVSASCSGGYGDYPLQTYSNGAKCGYSGGNATATVVCAAEGSAEAAGMRVVSGEPSGTCDAGETMVSAFCSGGGREYPLQTTANGAKCGYSGSSAEVTLVCMKL